MISLVVCIILTLIEIFSTIYFICYGRFVLAVVAFLGALAWAGVSCFTYFWDVDIDWEVTEDE